MISQILTEARQFENKEGSKITPEERPLFHLTPKTGWMNDPNGFSQYGGYYHLFYQYYPYIKKWGPMHWGHAVSKDLLRWEYLPAALAPDTTPDSGGCFSGSAVTLDDGKHMLMYTGVIKLNDLDTDNFYQTQCIAVGDGTNYEKYAGNPVIDIKGIPDGLSPYDFRDPKVWREKDGTFRCVVGGCTRTKLGRILYFKSDNGIDWEFVNVVTGNDGSLGTMWECPDLFELDGKYVLLTSPQDVIQSKKYNSGNITVGLIGTFDDETGVFNKISEQLVDAGIDFYATQTLLADDGRRIMTAWMQNWDSITYTERDIRWLGQMIIPRELSVINNRLYQKPVREIEEIRKNPVIQNDIPVEGVATVDGVSGRTIDLTVDIRPDGEAGFRKFEIRFARDEDQYTALVFRPRENEVEFDRTNAGVKRAVIHTRKCKVYGDHLKLRIILDRFSAEVFINDGEKTMTNVIYTKQSADGISFYADGKALIDIEKYDLEF